MPLVFIHGVNVRQGTKETEKARFRKSVEARDQFFRTIAFAGLVPPPDTLHIENPYWGDDGAKFLFDLASVPAPGAETFGPTDDVMAQVVMETIPADVAAAVQRTSGGEDSLLLTLARTHSLSQAVDAVVAAASVRGTDEGEEDELARFAAQAAAYADSKSDTAWLNATHPATGEPRLKDDSDFLEALSREVLASRTPAGGAVETFGGGIVERLKGAAKGLAKAAQKTLRTVVGAATGAVLGAAGGAAVGGAPGAVIRALRPVATRRAGIFLGDVFTYLAKPEPIVKTVAGALDAAADRRSAKDAKLVVVAHSMGGNIVYDILTHHRRDIQVDLLVTVGSQVGLFKELRLYREDHNAPPPGPSPARVKQPDAVGAWMNVFDPMDVLGFAGEGVFEGVRDFAFSNLAGPLDAHSLYFFRPMFHRRLRARMAELGFGAAE
jgi:hypothetical protein